MKTFVYFILILSLIIPPEAAVALAPESVRFESAVRGDRYTAEMLTFLFKWAGRQKKSVSLDALKGWFEKKYLEPVQIDEMLVVPAYNSLLIVYPSDRNETGTRLPNSGYRVLWIPKCVDIKTREDIEKVFSHIDNIRMAERILERLPKKEAIKNLVWGKLEGRGLEDTLILNPAVFFWAQDMLRRRYGNFLKRYELERKLLFAVLFQQFPDLDEKLKGRLEKFSHKCSLGGKGFDLIEADRFILSNRIYENMQFPEISKTLAERAEVIFGEINENKSIEPNSAVNFCSSLRALARVMPEFDKEKDFLNPEKIAARLMSYIVEKQGSVNLFEVLGNLERELKEYQRAGVRGLGNVLVEIRKASGRREATLEGLRRGILGSVLIEFFKRIPKADLHHHLDGSISPSLAFRVLQKYPQLMELYRNPATSDDMKKHIEFNYRGKGEIKWGDLWAKFAFFKDVINTGLEAVRFVFRESSLEDFRNDGLTLIEQKVSIVTPGQNPSVDPADVLTAAVRGLIDAEDAAKGRLQTGLIPCIWKTPAEILNRRYDGVVRMADADKRTLDEVIAEIPENEDPEFDEMLRELKRRGTDVKKQLIILYEARKEALEQVKMVVSLKEKWEGEKSKYAQYLIGIDTVGDEKDYIRWVNAPALRYAAENGLRITEHLGENWHPGELKYALLRIKQGIESGIVKRIGHATALGVNPEKFKGKCTDAEIDEIRGLQREIKELIRSKGIHIETCPSSNKLLVPERDMRLIDRYYDHPVVKFFQELGDVSINTDDSWILHTRGLSGELMKIWLAHPELTFSEIQKIISNGFKASFIDERVKEIQRLRHVVHDIANCWGIIYTFLGRLADDKNTNVNRILDEYRNMIANFSAVLALDYFQSKIPTLREIGNWVLAHEKEWQGMLKEEGDAQQVLEFTHRFLTLLSEFEFGREEEGNADLIKILKGLSISKSSVNLKLDISEDLPQVFVPSSELGVLRVFWNMISNSVKAGSGNMTITAEISGDALRIIVEDDGIGIREEYLQIPEGSDRPWIFLPGNTTNTDRRPEPGLGLSYVWDTVVEKWGGKISVESTAGEGMKFILDVPIKLSEPAEEVGPKDWATWLLTENEEEGLVHPVIKEKFDKDEVSKIDRDTQELKNALEYLRENKDAILSRIGGDAEGLISGMKALYSSKTEKWYRENKWVRKLGVILSRTGLSSEEKIGRIYDLVISRLEGVDIYLLLGLSVIVSRDTHRYSMLHSGFGRNSIYAPEGVWDNIKDNPQQLAAGLAHEAVDLLFNGHNILSSKLEQIIVGDENGLRPVFGRILGSGIKGILDNLAGITWEEVDRRKITLNGLIKEEVEKAGVYGYSRESSTMDEILEIMGRGEPLIGSWLLADIEPIDTIFGRIDLSRLNDITRYTGSGASAEIARDLEIAHYMGLIRIRNFKGVVGVNRVNRLTKKHCKGASSISASWPDWALIQYSLKELSELPKDGKWNGIPKKRYLEDDSGQILFYEKVFGKEEIKGKHLGALYSALPKEHKGKDNMLANWSMLILNYTEVIKIRNAIKELGKLGDKREWNGIPKKRYLKDDSGQILFYEKVFSGEEIKGKHLGNLYSALPKEHKGKRNMLANWSMLNLNYTEVMKIRKAIKELGKLSDKRKWNGIPKKRYLEDDSGQILFYEKVFSGEKIKGKHLGNLHSALPKEHKGKRNMLANWSMLKLNYTEVMKIRNAIKELGKLGDKQKWNGIPKKRYLEDDSGQILFYEKVFSEEEIKGKTLSSLYSALPKEYKGRGNMLANWSHIKMNYSDWIRQRDDEEWQGLHPPRALPDLEMAVDVSA